MYLFAFENTRVRRIEFLTKLHTLMEAAFADGLVCVTLERNLFHALKVKKVGIYLFLNEDEGSARVYIWRGS